MSSQRQYTKEEKAVIQDLLARFNQRRAKRKLPTIGNDGLPQLPPHLVGYHPSNLYLVDNYKVRRHWRRKPSRD